MKKQIFLVVALLSCMSLAASENLNDNDNIVYFRKKILPHDYNLNHNKDFINSLFCRKHNKSYFYAQDNMIVRWRQKEKSYYYSQYAGSVSFNLKDGRPY